MFTRVRTNIAAANLRRNFVWCFQWHADYCAKCYMAHLAERVVTTSVVNDSTEYLKLMPLSNNHSGYSVNRNVRYGPHNLADVGPAKNNNGHLGIMVPIWGYLHNGSDDLHCCEYSCGVRCHGREFVFMYNAWLEMHVWNVTQDCQLEFEPQRMKGHSFSMSTILPSRQI